MKLDAHQHFWRFDPAEHGWMTERMTTLRRDYLPDDLRPLLAVADMDGTVAVQARQSLAETRWLLELAARHNFIQGVVGWVDLRSPAVREQLAEFAEQPKFVGVRHVVHDESDDQFMLGSDFRRGIGMLAEFGLTYDLLLFPRHLPVAAKFVAEFPSQAFVLDHIAKPAIRVRTLSPWREDLRALAQFPNVFCKLSGLVTEAAWGRWQPEDFAVYFDAVFEAFGAERLMFGSDWPVCLLSGDYVSVTKLVTDYIAPLPAAAREAIMGGNSARFYGLIAPVVGSPSKP